MAAGSLPTSFPLSINDINVAFYSASNTKSLSGLAGDARISLPANLCDFLGTPYCKIVPAQASMLWAWDDFGSGVSDDSNLFVIPDKTWTVYSQPTWIEHSCNQTTNVITIWPGSENSNPTRTGRVCICAGGTTYGTGFVNVEQGSQ